MSFVYPTRTDLEDFVRILQTNKFRVSKYLPHIDEEWFDIIDDCVRYVENTARYEGGRNFHDCCARLLYKVAKRHELHDGNKRSAVITIFIFAVLNDHAVITPSNLKDQARRAAATKGRRNEELMKRRIAQSFVEDIVPFESPRTQ